MLTIDWDRLALANCFNGSALKIRVFERRLNREKIGRADGLKCLTLEMLDAIGVHDLIMSEACRHEEICHWSSDASGQLRRVAIVPDAVPGLDTPREVTLAQGMVDRRVDLKQSDQARENRTALGRQLDEGR